MNSMLIGYGLTRYITGVTPYPPTTILIDDKEMDNPTFSYWVQQDQLLLLGILEACELDARTIIS